LRKETEKGQIKSGRAYAPEKEKERERGGSRRRDRETDREKEGGTEIKGEKCSVG